MRFGRATADAAAILELAPKAGAGLLGASIGLNVLIGALPAAFILWTGVMFQRLVQADTQALAVAIGLAIGSFVLQQLLVPFQLALAEMVTRRVDGRCIRRVMLSALVDAPMSALDEQKTANRLADARDGFDRVQPTPGDAVAGTLALIARYTHLATAAVLIGVVLGILPGVIATATAIVIRTGQRRSLARFSELWDGLAGERRMAVYLRGLLTTPQWAKDIRVLRILPWLRNRHDGDSGGYLALLWSGRRRICFAPFLRYALVALVGGALTMVILAREAAGGGLSLLELSLAIQAALVPIRYGVYFPESDVKTQVGLQAYHAMVEFERAAARAAGVRTTARAVLEPPRRAIRFDEVVFGYGEKTVLRGLDLEIPVGRSTAVVGLNGAGKTTLVKLLARFYDPDAGRVLVDGVDLRDIDPRAWQRSLSVIFQDFVRYELGAADNIGLGAPDLIHDEAALLAAAERAGAGELLRSLPGGLSTPLSRAYSGGRDLSGGEWQRISLARALLAVDRGASVLILDEPTAQLDVRAEAEFYDRFLTLTQGLTTVVISHRFSTVRRADQIVVLEGGQVVECGSHDGLMRLDGRYAGLFRLQAQRFGDHDPSLEATR
ncbi:ATP-binding cassette domain-containing protein [Nonomuraea sp. NPDC049607]|uniref:ABC transporter ATP-binding protein n=1 Tax=Nonomuraea sp. NPDC049607 TaxID=3154732 RepID=UPI00343DC79B